MIEVEHDRICLAAVDAVVLDKVVKDPLAILLAILLASLRRARQVRLSITNVVLACVRALTCPALRCAKDRGFGP